VKKVSKGKIFKECYLIGYDGVIESTRVRFLTAGRFYSRKKGEGKMREKGAGKGAPRARRGARRGGVAWGVACGRLHTRKEKAGKKGRRGAAPRAFQNPNPSFCAI